MQDQLKEIIGEAYTDEMGDKIAKLYGKTHVPKAEFNERGTKIKEYEKTITDQTAELESLRQTNADVAAYEQQLRDKDAAHEAEINALKVDFAGINHMRELGARDPEIAWELAKRKLENPTLNAEGKVEGLDDAGDAVKSEKAYMFFESKEGGMEVAGAEPAHPGNKGEANNIDLNNGTYSQFIAAHQNE